MPPSRKKNDKLCGFDICLTLLLTFHPAGPSWPAFLLRAGRNWGSRGKLSKRRTQKFVL